MKYTNSKELFIKYWVDSIFLKSSSILFCLSRLKELIDEYFSKSEINYISANDKAFINFLTLELGELEITRNISIKLGKTTSLFIDGKLTLFSFNKLW